jgi:hypothetical protein
LGVGCKDDDLALKKITVMKYKEMKTGFNLAELLKTAMAHKGLFDDNNNNKNM